MNFVCRKSSRSLLIATSASLLLVNIHATSAQSNSPPATTATRPAKELPEQTSAPNNGPPATRTQTTGEANQDATIRKMNQDEKQKVDRTGK